MTDSVPQRIEGLSAQLEGLVTAAEGLDDDPGVAVSVRRIARSLETAAKGLELGEIAAGAMAIQRAADVHLARSVSNFLARIAELRDEAPPDEATILIVEDNETVATATKAYVKAEGRELLVAESAAEAVSILADREVDLVILDLILPDRDGRDLLVQMREDPRTAVVPVIVLSGRAGAVTRAECAAVGADEFLEKPADPKALRAAAARQIKRGKERRDALRDGLTGLLNRAGILAEYEQRRREAAEREEPLTVAVLAMDCFAEVTMKLGRDMGDRFLLEVCAAVHEAVGRSEGLGRWETSELVAILPERSPGEAREILGSTVASLAVDEALEDVRAAGIEIALSGGVTAAEPDQSLQDAVSSAQRSRYSAKSSGAQAVHSEADPLDLVTHRILMVEDDRVTATLLRHRLIRDGHDVEAFENGDEAHAWAVDNDFDLAILDVKVPGMDGFELLGRIREIPRCAEIPIVMLTGMGSEADVVRGLDLGADDYMLKPFSPSELLARVRRLLHAHPSAAATSSSDAGSELPPPTEARA